MQQKWEITWSDEYVSGNEEIDNYHKQIIDGVSELYRMLDDTSRYKDEIPELTRKLEDILVEHMDLEIDLLKKYNLSEWVAHEASHDHYKKEIGLYSQYTMPPLIRVVLVGESVRDYMKKHFFAFDVKDIDLINEKLKEETEHKKEQI